MTTEQKPGGLEVVWEDVTENYRHNTPAEPAEARIRSLEVSRDFFKHNMQQAESRATAAEAKLARAVEGLPDLSAVIAWLDNGCDPKHAADELRIHKARIDHALQQEGE